MASSIVTFLVVCLTAAIVAQPLDPKAQLEFDQHIADDRHDKGDVSLSSEEEANVKQEAVHDHVPDVLAEINGFPGDPVLDKSVKRRSEENIDYDAIKEVFGVNPENTESPHPEDDISSFPSTERVAHPGVYHHSQTPPRPQEDYLYPDTAGLPSVGGDSYHSHALPHPSYSGGDSYPNPFNGGSEFSYTTNPPSSFEKDHNPLRPSFHNFDGSINGPPSTRPDLGDNFSFYHPPPYNHLFHDNFYRPPPRPAHNAEGHFYNSPPFPPSRFPPFPPRLGDILPHRPHYS